MKKTISIRIGKGSISHNNRKFVAKNVDEKRVKDNMVLCNVDLKKTYDDLFSAALAEYNAKQKRKDRRIENYLDHIESGKQEKPFYELIFQIGNKDDTPCGTRDAEIATEILHEYYEDFLKRNPHIRVFNAVIHLDEATPHLHVDFVPFATEQSRGLSTRNSLSKALEQQGFSAKTNLETPAKQWTDFEKQQLAEIMHKRGIEWEQLGTHNEHLSVLDFKKQEREKEVKQLDGEIGSKELILEWRQQAVTEAEAIIDKIDAEYQEKSSEVERLDSVISEKENIKAKTEAVLSEKQAILGECIQKVVKINSIDHIETGKTIFGGKVTVAEDVYEKLTDLAKKQIADEGKESRLTEENAELKKENDALLGENETLREKVRAARTLQNSFSALQRELESWKQRYKKVIEFIENLGLKDKLEKFLHPVTQVKRGR
ncbi:MAG: plasmid recombination protein [Oscillospiraceae bacterium]|nr:plasmid recombination protein [Oscillospiraceae bacterium]